MSESSSLPPTVAITGEPPPALPPHPGLPPIGSDSPSGGQTTSTKDAAKEQASHVGQEAAHAGQHVAGVAKDQVAEVTQQAGQQAKQLLGQAQSQAKEQASAQQTKIVGGLRSLSDELSSMASNGSNQGVASDLARQAADRTNAVAGWLDGREPKDVLDEVTHFARRRPGAFLAIAVGLGFVAGRLTRGLANNSSDSSTSSTGAPAGIGTSPAMPADVDLRTPAEPAFLPETTASLAENYPGGIR
jgi:hypothetical protein